MTLFGRRTRPVSRKHEHARLWLALAVLAVCCMAWISPVEAKTPAWVQAAHGAPDRVLGAWADLNVGRGGMAPTIGLEYGREFGRLAVYGIGTIEFFDKVFFGIGAGMRYALSDAFEVGVETSFSRPQSHVFCSIGVGGQLRIGFEKGLQGRYDALSATYALADSLDLSVFVGSNDTYWVRISVHL